MRVSFYAVTIAPLDGSEPLNAIRRACSLNVEAVDRLDMEVRFGAVAGVPAMTENLADLNVLSRPNPCTSMLEMAERNDAPVAPDHHVIAGERQPPRASTPVLRQRIADQGQAP